MNNKVVIPIIVGVIIIIIGIIAMTNQELDTIGIEGDPNVKLQPKVEITPEIQEKIDDIKKENLENTYSPKDREWITSGPFQIDRSEYLLGEKIFLRVGELNYDETGQIAFLKPLNNTHLEVYLTISFDGSAKSAFNNYIEPQLSKLKGYCTADEFIGEWRVVFRGTDYSNLKFEIIDDTLPGSVDSFQPVC